jgi:predicted CoA-binding protein
VPNPNLLESEDAIQAIVRGMRTVAVLGMKDDRDPTQPAYTVPRNLQARGMRVIPVNPKLTLALGERAYASLADVPDRFDVVDVFRRPELMPSVAAEILALPPAQRPEVVWMQSGIAHPAAAQTLAEAGIKVVMDRCLGVYALRFRLPSIK